MRRAALLLSLAAALSGCGYSAGLTVPPEDGRSVGVVYFDNLTPERDLEAVLHQEVSRAARNLLEVPLAAPDRSDLVIQGAIVSYHRRGGVRTTDNMQIETGLTIEVEASVWRRRRPDDPPPAEPEGRRTGFGDSQKVRLSSRGVVYRRGSFQPGTPRRADPDWIQIKSARSAIQVGYILDGIQDREPEARARALRNLAERLVLDLFTPLT